MQITCLLAGSSFAQGNKVSALFTVSPDRFPAGETSSFLARVTNANPDSSRDIQPGDTFAFDAGLGILGDVDADGCENDVTVRSMTFDPDDDFACDIDAGVSVVSLAYVGQSQDWTPGDAVCHEVNLEAAALPDLDAIVGKALEREPEDRYRSAAELAVDLRRWLSHQPVSARSIGPLRRCHRFVRRHALLTAVAGATLAGLLAVTWGALRREEAAARDLYRLQVREASTALRLGDTAAARAALASTSEERRGWEWRHLAGRVDPAVARASLADWPQALRWGSGGDVLLGLGRRECALWRWDGESLSPERHVVGRDPEDDRFAVSSDLSHLLFVRRETGEEPRLRAELADLHAGEHRLLGEFESRLLGREGFSPDGRRVFLPAGRGEEVRLRVLDAASGAVASKMPRRYSPESSDVAWSADGRWLFAQWQDSGLDVSVHDARSGEVVATVPLDFSVRRFVLDDGGRLLIAYADEEPRIACWHRRGAGLEPAWIAKIDEAAIVRFDQVVVNEHATRIAATDENGRTVLLDAADGRVVVTTPMTGRASDIPPTAAAFSPDGETLAIAGSGGHVLLHGARDGELRERLPGFAAVPTALAFHPGGRWLAAGGDRGEVRIFDLEQADRTVLRGHESYVYDVSFGPRGDRFASSAWDGTVRVWDAMDGRQLLLLDAHARLPYQGRVAVSPDGTRIASVHDETVSLWNAATGAREAALAFQPEAGAERGADGTSLLAVAAAVAWHPSGDRFAIACRLRRVHCWSVGEGSPRLATWPLSAWALDWAPGGSVVAWVPSDPTDFATGGSAGRLEVWEVDGPHPRRLRVLRSGPGIAHRIAVSPDGRFVASAWEDGRVRISDTSGGGQVAELRADELRSLAVAWSPDGARLATGGDDRLVRIWDTTSWRELVQLPGHEAYVHALAFSPVGGLLVSGGGDRTVRVWSAPEPPG